MELWYTDLAAAALPAWMRSSFSSASISPTPSAENKRLSLVLDRIASTDPALGMSSKALGAALPAIPRLGISLAAVASLSECFYSRNRIHHFTPW